MASRHSISGFLLALASCCLCAAQTNSRTVVEAFFAPEGIRDKSEVYTGEMLHYVQERTMGQYLGPDASKDFRLLRSSGSTAVYAVAVKSNGKTKDWYAFVRKANGTWRLEAVRTLAQTGLIEAVAASLRRKLDRTPEEDWNLKNADLTLQSDEELRVYLQDNLSKFEALARVIRSGAGSAGLAAKHLYLSSAKAKETGAVEFVIGGMLDNTVGYLYLPEGTDPPEMQPDEVIYLERITGHWYIFKTT